MVFGYTQVEATMRLSQLQYGLLAERIRSQPIAKRDGSRLLVLDRRSGRVRHEVFSRLPGLLPRGSLLVLNDTRGVPARLRLRRRTGGRVEGLYLREDEGGLWEVMLRGAGRLKRGEELEIEGTARRLRFCERVEARMWRAEPIPDGNTLEILEEAGLPPLPPYIDREGQDSPAQVALDRERYQTIYAARPGAVAAPTAGLHFTEEVFRGLDAAGIGRATVTLHVGVGTFAPIRCERLADHEMHAEWYSCPAETAAAVNAARAEGRQVAAAGTTSVRVLETCADEGGLGCSSIRHTSLRWWTRW